MQDREQTIRDYFLGKLSESERERLDESIALDESLFADSQAAEMELVDDYLRRSMSEPDREAFENYYLCTGARRERLAASDALWQVANSDRSTERAVVSEQRARSTGWGWWIASGATAATALLLTGIFSGVVPIFVDVDRATVANNDGRAGSSTDVRDAATPAPVPGDAVFATNPDNSQTVIRIPIDPTPSPLDKPVSTVAFTLVPGPARGGVKQSINLRSQTRIVQLDLARAKGSRNYQSYSATLKTKDGAVALKIPKLKSMRLQIPAQHLEKRNYVLFLQGVKPDGSTVPVSEYTFAVLP
ncbi:MAG TPA: hypothetical protein VMZ26_08120 [Pyrinomonadaceae bacterium]|nr:hypothetical protein [Pyrinomonadaceae bacterium]